MSQWNTISTKALYIITFFILLTHPSFVYAADPLCSDESGVNTAFGCMPTEPAAFLQNILSIAIPIAGGVAFIMAIASGFTVLASRGEPKKLEQGKERFLATSAGLILIIFSIFLLRLLGFTILTIPGFG